MACMCGHDPEDHEDETGPCEENDLEGDPCGCLGYEEDPDEADADDCDDDDDDEDASDDDE